MINNVDFKSIINYYFNTIYDCESYGCDSICRCGQIEDVHVISVDIIKVSNHIYGLYFDNSKSSKRDRIINNILGDITEDINYYTIDRILRINNVYDPDNWDINICNGYYGEEIESVKLIDSLSTKIENQLEEAFYILDLSKRIEYLLKMEYGYILDILKGKKYELSVIDKNDIIFGSDSQYKKVKNMDLSYYDSSYKSFRGIVIEKNKKYQLVDGYHRCLAVDNKIKVIKAI